MRKFCDQLHFHHFHESRRNDDCTRKSLSAVIGRSMNHLLDESSSTINRETERKKRDETTSLAVIFGSTVGLVHLIYVCGIDHYHRWYTDIADFCDDKFETIFVLLSTLYVLAFLITGILSTNHHCPTHIDRDCGKFLIEKILLRCFHRSLSITASVVRPLLSLQSVRNRSMVSYCLVSGSSLLLRAHSALPYRRQLVFSLVVPSLLSIAFLSSISSRKTSTSALAPRTSSFSSSSTRTYR